MIMNRKATLFTFILAIVTFQAMSQETFLPDLLKDKSPVLQKVFSQPEKYRLQIIFTEIKRDKKNKPKFKTHRFRTHLNEYFYPASTVKLAASVLGLEKIHEFEHLGVTKETTMLHQKNREAQTEAKTDSTSETGLPSLAHYIKKILLVSDNDAYNRIYEWIGQKEINQLMEQKGFKDVRLVHRLQIPLPPEENRHTNAVQFVAPNGKVLFEERAKENTNVIKSPEPILLGKGTLSDDGKIDPKPLEFTYKNAFPLEAQHDLLKRILFPEAVKKSEQFKLNEDDYGFLRKYMSMYPTESLYPNYQKDPAIFPAYCKFLYYGGNKDAVIDPDIKIFNKVGDAYGFLLDNAYVVNEKKKIEFMVSATILCNEDEIFNDDKYDYDTIGFPFFKDLGQALYQYMEQN